MTFQVSTLLVEISSGGRNRCYGFMSPTFGMPYSDSRLKDNVRLIHRPNGHNVYTWDWNKQNQSVQINNLIMDFLQMNWLVLIQNH